MSHLKFKEDLFLATKKSYFIFNRKLCKQVDGVAMSSPLIIATPSSYLQSFLLKKKKLFLARNTFSLYFLKSSLKVVTIRVNTYCSI